LARAQTAEWPIENAAEIRRRFFAGTCCAPPSRSGVAKASPLLQIDGRLSAAQLNDAVERLRAARSHLVPQRPIYFDVIAKRLSSAVWWSSARWMSFLGHGVSERLVARATAVGPTIYRRRAARMGRAFSTHEHKGRAATSSWSTIPPSFDKHSRRFSSRSPTFASRLPDAVFALERLQRERADVIVLDLEMPRMDGSRSCESSCALIRSRW
jgi:hypothetical protein